jgi:hypothetical protein
MEFHQNTLSGLKDETHSAIRIGTLYFFQEYMNTKISDIIKQLHVFR